MKNAQQVVKRCWPFFFRECKNCGLLFKFEVGYKVTRNMFEGKKAHYICNSCAPSLISAQSVANCWPGSVWVNVVGYVPRPYVGFDMAQGKDRTTTFIKGNRSD